MVVNDERHTAIHEAGHVVIGRVLGMVCGYVTIEADEELAGHHIVADPLEVMQAWDRREHYRDPSKVFNGRMMTLMAGALAEIEFFGECVEGGDGADQSEVALMAEDDYARIPKITGDWNTDRDRQIERLRARAAGLVRRHRQPIERVADALLAKRRLSEEEVDALLASRCASFNLSEG